ncbi:MAG: hypothetical protein AB1610_06005 [Nitrospirota bacterium]
MKDKKYIIVNCLLLFLLLFISSACAKKEILKKPQPAFIPVPEKITAEEFIDRLPFHEINTIKAEIKLSIKHNEENKGTFSGLLIYKHPDRLNMRIYGPLGFTLMETLFDKGLVYVFIPPKDVLYNGIVPFDRLLPDYNDLANSMKLLEDIDDIYVLYIIGTPQNMRGEADSSRKDDLILKAKYFFNKTDLSLRAVELYSNNKKQLRIEIYKNDSLIPSDIGIYFKNTFLHLELKDIAINNVLDEDYFKPLTASQRFPLSRFLRNLAPNP